MFGNLLRHPKPEPHDALVPQDPAPGYDPGRRADLLVHAVDDLLKAGCMSRDEPVFLSLTQRSLDIGGYRYSVEGYRNKIILCSPRPHDPALSMLADTLSGVGFEVLLLSDSLRVMNPLDQATIARRRLVSRPPKLIGKPTRT